MSDEPAGESPSGDDAEAPSSATSTTVCGACGAEGATDYCRQCGFEISAAGDDSVGWPKVGDSVPGQDDLKLEVELPTVDGARRFIGRRATGPQIEIFVTQQGDPGRVLRQRQTARLALGGFALVPDGQHNADGLEYTTTRLPKVPSLADGLAQIFDRTDQNTPAERVKRWVKPLLRCLAELCDSGYFLGALDPAEILIGTDGRCAFRGLPRLHSLAMAPIKAGLRTYTPGFAAPEQVGACTGQLDERTDVFLVGLILYYVLCEAGPLEETTRPLARLPAPQVFSWEAPADLVAVAQRATSPVPARRYRSVREMQAALEQALKTHAARVAEGYRRLTVDLGRELHIGVLKGQYAPINQDNLFAAWHPSKALGLLWVSDGVSISQHGSGDQASGFVRDEAEALWRRICAGQAVAEGETPSAEEASLPASAEGRERLIRGALDRANARIAERIHEDRPQFTGPPEGIMAATSVCALIEGNRVTLANIGDSRIYLGRDGHLVSLMVDHDLGTQLIRMGRAPTVARAAPSAAALIRCVGEFEKDPDDRLVPVPLQPEFRQLTLLPGDTLMLCSDGIPDYGGYDHEHAEDRILQILDDAPNAAWAAFELMVLANRGGGGDNISAVVARFGQLPGGRV